MKISVSPDGKGHRYSGYLAAGAEEGKAGIWKVWGFTVDRQEDKEDVSENNGACLQLWGGRAVRRSVFVVWCDVLKVKTDDVFYPEMPESCDQTEGRAACF